MCFLIIICFILFIIYYYFFILLCQNSLSNKGWKPRSQVLLLLVQRRKRGHWERGSKLLDYFSTGKYRGIDTGDAWDNKKSDKKSGKQNTKCETESRTKSLCCTSSFARNHLAVWSSGLQLWYHRFQVHICHLQFSPGLNGLYFSLCAQRQGRQSRTPAFSAALEI